MATLFQKLFRKMQPTMLESEFFFSLTYPNLEKTRM